MVIDENGYGRGDCGGTLLSRNEMLRNALLVGVATLAVYAAISRTSTGVTSVISQTLHYLARPHASIRTTQISSKAAWTGDQLKGNESAWTTELSYFQKEELIKAVTHAKSLNVPTRKLKKEDFAISSFDEVLDTLKRELGGMDGLGFHLIRGIPVQKWNNLEQEIFCWCFGLHLGRPGAQDNDGALVGHDV